MTNLEKYTNVFVEAFGITAEQTKGLAYQAIDTWDSVGHMTLMAALEDTFDIMLDPEDILLIDSYTHIKEVLAKNDIETASCDMLGLN